VQSTAEELGGDGADARLGQQRPIDWPKPAVLVVEDDESTRELMVTVLDLAGYQPEACRDASEALASLRMRRFDLVLTDYSLPRLSGGALLRQATDEGLLDSTPAIVVTAHPQPREAAGFEIVPKPFEVEALVERIRQRLDAHGALRPADAAAPRDRVARPPDVEPCPGHLELVLYVADRDRCAAGIATVAEALQRRSGTATLTLRDPHDGAAPPAAGSGVRPHTVIVGHADSPDTVLQLIDECDDPA
jgi:CheY-like chemotaxis protein